MKMKLSKEAKPKINKVQFNLYAPEAEKVCLAGDFNNWDVDHLLMKRDKKGTWMASFSLPPGRYEYRFRVAATESGVKAALPRLVDLGAGKCIPCKKMAPILEELKKEYAGRMEVEFIDVWKNPDAGKAYGIEMIPTQIFLRRQRHGAVPAYGVLRQGRHSGQVEGTGSGIEIRRPKSEGRRQLDRNIEQIEPKYEDLTEKHTDNERCALGGGGVGGGANEAAQAD